MIDEPLLDYFRHKSQCEACGKAVRTGLEPHHILSRGMGGSSRMDHQLNLAALCLRCHKAHHDGNQPSRSVLLDIVAWREGWPSGDALLLELYRMRRSPT